VNYFFPELLVIYCICRQNVSCLWHFNRLFWLPLLKFNALSMLSVLTSARSACTEQPNILTAYCFCYKIFKTHMWLLTYLLHGATLLIELWLPHIFLSIVPYRLFLTSIFWVPFSPDDLQHYQSILYVAFLCLLPPGFPSKAFFGSLCSSILQMCPNHLNHKIHKFFIWSYSPYPSVIFWSKYFSEYLSFPDINLWLIFFGKSSGLV
jgi:hypothetical protein